MEPITFQSKPRLGAEPSALSRTSWTALNKQSPQSTLRGYIISAAVAIRFTTMLAICLLLNGACDKEACQIGKYWLQVSKLIVIIEISDIRNRHPTQKRDVDYQRVDGQQEEENAQGDTDSSLDLDLAVYTHGKEWKREKLKQIESSDKSMNRSYIQEKNPHGERQRRHNWTG